MRFETSGELRRLDLTPIADLLPVLRDEWAGLRFDPDGRLLNRLTGDASTALALVSGRHRQAGADYRITASSPTYELPQDRRAEFEKEARKLTRRHAKPAEWEDHVARRHEASVRVGTAHERFAAKLREDTARKLAFTVSDEQATWAVDVDVEHGRLPKVDLRGRVDLTAVIKADGTPGCLAGLLGGTGRGAAVLDLEVLDRGGQVVRAKGRANRFRGTAQLDVRTSATTWTAAGKGTIRARGLGRPVLWLAGRRIRRSVHNSFAELWATADSQTGEVERQLSRLRAAIEHEGGPASFIRRALWDPDFDPGLGPLRRRV